MKGHYPGTMVIKGPYTEEERALITKAQAYRTMRDSDGYKLLLAAIRSWAQEALDDLDTKYMEEASLREAVIVYRETKKLLERVQSEVSSAIEQSEAIPPEREI